MNARFQPNCTGRGKPVAWTREGAAVVTRGLQRLANAGLLEPTERDRLMARIAALPTGRHT